jgi:hypothetical protein
MPSFSCPNCQKVLKSSNPIAPGKKIKCPSCTKIFVMPEADEETTAISAKKPSLPPRKPVPAESAALAKKRRPVPDDDEEAAEQTSRKAKAADEEAEDQEEEEEEAPKKSKKKKKAGSRKGLLIGLGAGGGVLILVLILGFVWPGFFVSSGPTVTKAPLKKPGPVKVAAAPVQEAVDIYSFIPNNCEFVAGANFAGGLNFAQKLGLLMQMGGASPEEIKVYNDLNRAFIAGSIPSPSESGPKNIVEGFVLKAPVDDKKIVAALKAEPPQTVQGKTLHKFSNPSEPGPQFLWIGNDQTFLTSPMSDSEFAKILETPSKLPPEFEPHVSALKDKTFWGALNLQALVKKGLFDLKDLAKIPGGEDIAPAVSNAKLATFFVETDKKFHVQLDLHCANDQDAGQLEAFAQKGWDEMVKPQLESAGGMLALAGFAGEPAKALLDDVGNAFKIQKQGAIVTASITFSEASFNAVKDFANPPKGKIPPKAKPMKK